MIKLRPWDLSIKVELDNIKSKLSKDSLSLPLTIPIYKKYLNPYIEPFMNKLKEIYNNFSLRINENIMTEFNNLWKSKYSEYKQHDLLGIALQDFIKKYK